MPFFHAQNQDRNQIVSPPEAVSKQRSNWMEFLLRFFFAFCVIVLLLLILYQSRRLKQVNRKLSSEVSLYRSILEDQVELICRFNPDLTLSYINEAFCSFLGQDRKNLMGQVILKLLPASDLNLFFHELSKINPSTPLITHEYLFTMPNGTTRWHYWTIRAIFDKHGSITEYQASGRDITDLKKVHEILIRTKEEAESANRAKSDFLARMSHELRTPLNSVIGFASILLKNKGLNLSGRDINYLSRIFANGTHLLDLINQILDLSKIESGKIVVEQNSVYLDRLIWEILDQLEDQVRGKKIQLRCDIPDTIAPIQTDQGKFKQILFNLIGNAIKFTEKGSVMVRVIAHPDTHRPVRLDVIDTGIGIPPDRLTQIFEPFLQADSNTSRQFGGTGLGLTISKSLCELLGFRIEVDSHFGEGSCFRIVMDSRQEPEFSNLLDESEDRSQLVTYAESDLPYSMLTGKMVLIIDDEQDARILLQHIVEDFGCKVIMASSGKEGLQLASEHHPDIVLIDVLMPEMNGWEVIISLKSDPELCTIPVVIVSIVASDLKGVSLGLVDLVDKPVDPDLLYRVMQQNLCETYGYVLLAGENDKVRNRVLPVLNDENLDYCVAENWEEAREHLESELLDVLILDLYSADSKGIEFLNRVRGDLRFHHLPIFVIIAEQVPELQNPSLQIDTLVYSHPDFEHDLRNLLNKILQE